MCLYRYVPFSESLLVNRFQRIALFCAYRSSSGKCSSAMCQVFSFATFSANQAHRIRCGHPPGCDHLIACVASVYPLPVFCSSVIIWLAGSRKRCSSVSSALSALLLSASAGTGNANARKSFTPANHFTPQNHFARRPIIPHAAKTFQKAKHAGRTFQKTSTPRKSFMFSLVPGKIKRQPYRPPVMIVKHYTIILFWLIQALLNILRISPEKVFLSAISAPLRSSATVKIFRVLP